MRETPFPVYTSYTCYHLNPYSITVDVSLKHPYPRFQIQKSVVIYSNICLILIAAFRVFHVKVKIFS